MQPLYTVDHETRHNSANVTEDERRAEPASENSPLLQQFPSYSNPRSPVTTITVSFLLIILLTGVIIGIYLLVIQSESENVLPPPVAVPLQLVSRSQWDHKNISQYKDLFSLSESREVMVVQTNTDACDTTETCMKLIQAMQVNATTSNRTMPYNFLISSNGQSYEVLGWHRSPIAAPQLYDGLVLALIGNFSDVQPTPLQMRGAKNFLAMSVSQQHLHPTFRIIGKNINDTPKYLSESFMRFAHWTNEFADGNMN